MSFSFCPSCGGSLESTNDPDCISRVENVGRETAAINSRKRASSSQLTRPELLRAKLPTYEQFASKKSNERRGHFKLKSSKHSSAMTIKEATINIALMEYVTEEEGDILKPVRGSSLPVKIKTDGRYDEVLEAALKKREDFDHKFSQTMHGGYVLGYPDSRIAKKMPRTSDEFGLSNYKDWLGRPYSRINLYLSPIERKDIGESDRTASEVEIIDWSELEHDINFDNISLSLPEMDNSAVPELMPLIPQQNEDIIPTADLSFVATDFL